MNDLHDIRTIGIIAHIDAGKTTSTERMLYLSGRTHRSGEVDDGSTVMDYLDEERARGITIVSAAATFQWQDTLIHLIDTPGHIDFTAEVERSLRVIDGAVVIFSGVEGVEAQSEKVWFQADRYKLPRLAIINKLDRVGASFERVLGEINDKFQDRGVPLQYPVGSESDFDSVIDLITMQQWRFDEHDAVASDIDSELVEIAESARIAMIERLADHSDELAEAYLQSSELTAKKIYECIRQLTLANQIIPVLAGSAKKTVGIQLLLDSIIRYLPSPADITGIPAFDAKSGADVTLTPGDDAPFAGLVFKVVAGKSADLYYLRTYTGTLQADTAVYQPRTKQAVKLKRLLRLYAKSTEPLDVVGPGDIIGFMGPRDIITGDTLCDRRQQVMFERMNFPEPVISMAIEPQSTKDRGRLEEILTMLAREDPTLNISEDENTGQCILSGMGELHLEVTVKRIVNEFNTAVHAGEPRVAYRESITKAVTETATFERNIGDAELYARATIALSPSVDHSTPFVVENRLRNGNLPKAFVKAAMEALNDGVKTGGNNGYPLIYVKAELMELEIHADRTTDGAVLGAVLQAMDQAISTAGTEILEPMMRVDIFAPEETTGEISNYLQGKRSLIHGVDDVLELKRIRCEMPLAEMFGFSKAVPQLTGGRGSFSMDPCGYRAVES
ncbi:MAG TPA: elongation factor G [Lentisphaeria bacterium]|nr:elongation factor G [Lentisphaeria bacterium]|tara:strand:- start:584 stop:2605 length:2022 start_codon:yes stop_codon:yes gene_type:complete